MHPSMRPYQAKRDTSSRSRSASPKRSAPSDAGRDNSEMGRQGKLSAVKGKNSHVLINEKELF